MSTYLGIDIGTSFVRAARIRSAYRHLAVEAVLEVDRASAPTLADAVRAAAAPLLVGGDSIAVSFEGERSYVRRLSIPVTGAKQIDELVPFELEAELPFDIDQAVHDHITLRRSGEQIPILAAAARVEDVRDRIAAVKQALGMEPERVVPGALALAGIVSTSPAVATTEPVVLVDLGEQRSEVLILERGEPVFARTVSCGTAGLPGSAGTLARELKQTIASFRAAGGARPENAYLLGEGAAAAGAEEFLTGELGLPVRRLPDPDIAIEPTVPPETMRRFAKPLALALSLAPRTRTLSLRRGALAYEGGFGFLRDKGPLLSVLAAVIVVSFVFATLAELWALGRARKTLEAALGTVTQDVLGTSTSDVQRAVELLDKNTVVADEDPMPHADGFDVLVQISQAVPESIKHDIEELDIQRGKTTVHGIVPTIPDAQQLATQLKSFRCFQDVKIVRTNQVVGEERQKYTLELELKCPQEGKEKGTAPAGSASAAAAGGKP